MFDNILGNKENKITLKNSIENGQILHSYIFTGPVGIGKFLFAKEFAKAILCQGKTKPCNQCEACISFNGNNNPDILMIDEEDKSIKTETIKELVKNAYEKPIRSSKKVYIINNSHNMTKEAQNSLLKTLEDPPQYLVIILITDNDNLLLNTIKSRCSKVRFNRLDNKDVEYILKTKFEIKDVSQNLLEIGDRKHKKCTYGT